MRPEVATEIGAADNVSVWCLGNVPGIFSIAKGIIGVAKVVVVYGVVAGMTYKDAIISIVRCIVADQRVVPEPPIAADPTADAPEQRVRLVSGDEILGDDWFGGTLDVNTSTQTVLPANVVIVEHAVLDDAVTI